MKIRSQGLFKYSLPLPLRVQIQHVELACAELYFLKPHEAIMFIFGASSSCYNPSAFSYEKIAVLMNYQYANRGFLSTHLRG